MCDVGRNAGPRWGNLATRNPPDTKVLIVNKRVSTSGWRRWLALVASVVVSAAMIVYAGGGAEAPCCDEPPAAAPAHPESASPEAPRVATPAEAELLAASAPAAAQEFQFALPKGVAPEGGLQVKTIWAARAISVLFPEVTTIGGYRQDPLRWHPEGLAIDVMIPNWNTPEGIELGNQIAGLALANAQRWGILHVIWRQGYYPGVGDATWTADYGSITANHYDHVHIATNGGGYPTGNETYYIGSMQRGGD
ncbi:glycoside hydrolase [Mycolicibacterium thermoresistibile]